MTQIINIKSAKGTEGRFNADTNVITINGTDCAVKAIRDNDISIQMGDNIVNFRTDENTIKTVVDARQVAVAAQVEKYLADNADAIAEEKKEDQMRDMMYGGNDAYFVATKPATRMPRNDTFDS